jgi:hypothetical protein
MKKCALIILFICSGILAFAQPVIKFEKPLQRLGFVHQGDTLTFQYVFTNTGDQPLVISDSKVACSCTSVKLPAQPVLPNKQGVLIATFVTTHAIDRQDRTITVISNASNSSVELRFRCVVLKAKNKT